MRYAKLGKVRFTSHRDTARIWERALRRAGLPVATSARVHAPPADQLRAGAADRCRVDGRVPRRRARRRTELDVDRARRRGSTDGAAGRVHGRSPPPRSTDGAASLQEDRHVGARGSSRSPTARRRRRRGGRPPARRRASCRSTGSARASGRVDDVRPLIVSLAVAAADGTTMVADAGDRRARACARPSWPRVAFPDVDPARRVRVAADTSMDRARRDRREVLALPDRRARRPVVGA